MVGVETGVPAVCNCLEIAVPDPKNNPAKSRAIPILTVRNRRERLGCTGILGLAAHTRVKHIAQGIAYKVPAQNEEHKGKTRPDNDIPVRI